MSHEDRAIIAALWARSVYLGSFVSAAGDGNGSGRFFFLFHFHWVGFNSTVPNIGLLSYAIHELNLSFPFFFRLLSGILLDGFVSAGSELGHGYGHGA